MPTTARFGLTLQRGPFVDANRRIAYARLMRDVLELGADPAEPQAGPWTSFALFAGDSRCIGNVDAAVLSLTLDGRQAATGGIRSVAIDPDWRGRGLFRDLMTEALAWCGTRGATSTLLYTEDPSLYERFGFQSLPQHAFVGAAPPAKPGRQAQRLDFDRSQDRAIIRALVGRRAPLSVQCALTVDAALLIENIANDPALHVAYASWIDTLIVHEMVGEELVLADIVAPRMPDLPAVVGALARRPGTIKTLFPPDQIGWNGSPVTEDTGLMIRGPVPPAMARPFMFPPTAEF